MYSKILFQSKSFYQMYAAKLCSQSRRQNRFGASVTKEFLELPWCDILSVCLLFEHREGYGHTVKSPHETHST